MLSELLKIRRKRLVYAASLTVVGVWYWKSVFNLEAAQTDSFDHLWRELWNITEAAKPSFGQIQIEGKPLELDFDLVTKSNVRPELVILDSNQIAELASKHRTATNQIKVLSKQLRYRKHSRGIVMTSAYWGYGMQALSLYMLRQTGSTLPVELWLWNNTDYDEAGCRFFADAFDAHCRLMSDLYPSDLPPPFSKAFTGRYAFKALAMIFSSFKDFIFMDYDVFPVVNPDSLFDTEPFISKHWIIWPDQWVVTASKFWYEISGQPVVALQDRRSSESGQMMVSKKSHAAALLMAWFYNYYGPEYWHVLWSQGSNGQGDKESYIPAAQAFRLPWYQIKQGPHIVGHSCGHAGQYPPTQHRAFGHSNPLDDFQGLREKSQLLFFHHHLPKLDANGILTENERDAGWAVDILQCGRQGRTHRLWDTEDGRLQHLYSLQGDVEKKVWQGLRWLACEHMQDIKVWREPTPLVPVIRNDTCQKIREIYADLFSEEEPHS